MKVNERILLRLSASTTSLGICFTFLTPVLSYFVGPQGNDQEVLLGIKYKYNNHENLGLD